MTHNSHSFWMVGLLVGGAALYFSGVAGGGLFLLWPIACMVMMVFMMRGMSGMHGEAEKLPKADQDETAPRASAPGRKHG